MNEFLSPIGEVIVHWLLAWSAVALAVALFVLVARPRRAGVRYAAWLVATFAGLILAPLVAGVTPRFAWRDVVGNVDSPVASPAVEATEQFESWFQPSGEPLVEPLRQPTGVAEPVVAPTGIRAGDIDIDLGRFSASQMGTWLAGLWMVGVAICFFRLARGFRYSRRLLAESSPATCRELCRQFTVAVDAIGLRRRVRLAVHPEIPTPICIGGLRGTVVWPASDHEQMADRERRAAMVHELTHLRRYDDWINLAAEIWRAVVWFYIPMHWLIGRLRREQEFMCDDVAVAEFDRPQSYAQMLLDLSCVNVRLSSICTAFIGPDVKGRIGRLLDTSLPKLMPLCRAQVVGLAIVGCVLVVCASSVRLVGFAAQPATINQADALPDVKPAELSERLAASMKTYARGYLEVEYQKERNVNAFRSDKTEPLMVHFPGRFRYASDGTRWRGEYEGVTFTLRANSHEMSPRSWSAGFDGNTHFHWRKPSDSFAIGEQLPSEGIPLPGFGLFWSPYIERFAKSLAENDWRIEGQETFEGYRCYRLVRESTRNGKVSRYELTVSPRQGYLPVRYKVVYDGKVSWMHELFDLAQADKGQWFPGRVKRTHPNLSRTFDARVTRYEPNREFTDAYFRMEIPAGVGVIDYRSGLAYRNDPWRPEIKPVLREQFDWPPVGLGRLRELGLNEDDLNADDSIDGQPAPPITPQEWIHGQPVDLKQLRGKVVLLYFTSPALLHPDPQWTSALKGLYDIYHPTGLELVEINTHAEDTSQAKHRVEELRIPWPVAVDAASTASTRGKTFAAYQLDTYISPVLVDHEGRVRLVPRGKLVEMVVELLQAAGVENVTPVASKPARMPSGMMDTVDPLWKQLVKNAPKNARITGRATDADGGLAQVEIEGRLQYEQNMFSDMTSATFVVKAPEAIRETTDDSGRFELNGLAKGVYILMFRSPGRARVERRIVVPEDTSALAVDVEMNQPDGVEGRVVTTSGEPVAGADVRIRHRHPSLERKHHHSTYNAPPAMTDNEGHFAFKNLQSGAYSFDVSRDGFAAAALEHVPAGSRDAVVTLAKNLEPEAAPPNGQD